MKPTPTELLGSVGLGVVRLQLASSKGSFVGWGLGFIGSNWGRRV